MSLPDSTLVGQFFGPPWAVHARAHGALRRSPHPPSRAPHHWPSRSTWPSRTTGDVTDNGKISYIVDPTTWTPLEDSVLNGTGALVERQTILSLTTTATMPADPYTP